MIYKVSTAIIVIPKANSVSFLYVISVTDHISKAAEATGDRKTPPRSSF